MKVKLVVLTLALAVAAFFAGAVHAGVTCSTDAAAEVASATVTDRGTNWGPTPLWTIDFPDLSMSVDLYANDEASARAAATDWLSGQISSACSADNPSSPSGGDGASAPSGGTSSSPTAPTDYSAQAQALAASATVTLLGNSWGATPLWEVSVPSLNMSVDVYANSADEARTAAIPTIQSALENAAGGGGGGTSSGGQTATASAPTSGEPTTATTTVPPANGAASQTDQVALARSEGYTQSVGYLIRAGIIDVP